MKTAIVTGAGGFMGRNLIKKLTTGGVRVYAIDIPTVGGAQFLGESVEFLPVEAGSFEGIYEKLGCCRPDVFYHLAWAGVNSTDKNDIGKQFFNIQYTIQAIELAKKLDAGKVICPGSTSEYAYCNEIVNGKNAPAPGDMYAAVKTAIHFISLVYAGQNQIPHCWMLIPSVYGPGRNDNNLITYCIQELLNGNKPSFTKLEQLWDYLYIDDLMQALYLIGEKGRAGVAYPVGSGQARPLAEYVHLIRDAINPSLPLGIGELPYKMGKPDSSVVDISLIQEHTGFVPSVPFEEGIRKTIEYYKKNQRSARGKGE